MFFDDLIIDTCSEVYTPDEDSFMLALAAKGLKGKILEIGCGSGIVSLSAAKTADLVIGVDINPAAISCSRKNSISNNLKNTIFISSNLFENVSGQFDAILFNPPYLPTTEDEKLSGQINFAYDGGSDGRHVLDKFLSEFKNFLNDKGKLLLLQSSINDLEKTKKIIETLNLSFKIIDQRSFFFEKLYVIEAKKKF